MAAGQGEVHELHLKRRQPVLDGELAKWPGVESGRPVQQMENGDGQPLDEAFEEMRTELGFQPTQ